MSSLDEIQGDRIKKLRLLKEGGMDPYPSLARRTTEVGRALRMFDALAGQKKALTMAGRIMSLRRQGGLIFFHFFDGTGTLQATLKKDDAGERLFSLFENAADVGDFVELAGVLGMTQRGERTLFAREWRMLAKSIRPLPDKWHGLQDIEERFRRRYLDLAMSPETRARFLKRTEIIALVRALLNKAGYLEVETPALQPLYGGASAEPFVTHHNTLDVDLYLRISDELYLKRLLVGGFPRIYEIGKNFRNEGIDATHYPEFTMLEFYEAYTDARRQMRFVERLIKTLAKRLYGKASIRFDGEDIDLSRPFAVVPFRAALEKYAHLAKPLEASRDELFRVAKEHGAAAAEGDSRAKLLDLLFKKLCRRHLVQPTFVTEYPTDYLPLAKEKKRMRGVADAFQLYIGGVELVKAFSELNDPAEQRSRFLAEERFRTAGDEEAQRLDEDFLEAMEYGMPPAGGVGIGIDRLVMVLTDTKNIKEVILFPAMRPKR